jgi:phosphoribosylanthranilate isomerase
MNKVQVKICGITSLKDLQTVVDAGADAVGCIINVPDSPRSVTVEEAKKLFQKATPFMTTVAVMVVDDPVFPIQIYDDLKPDVLQLHAFGDHAPEIRNQIPNSRMIGAIPANPNAFSVLKQTAKFFDAILVDSSTHEKHGGTGTTHDWSLSNRIKETLDPKPLILAGGLTSQNVHEAIRTVQPYAIDVASGVESQPGRKDPSKVYEFVKKAKGFET